MRILCYRSCYYVRHPVTGKVINFFFKRDTVYDTDALRNRLGEVPHNAFLNRHFVTEEGMPLELPENDIPKGKRKGPLDPAEVEQREARQPVTREKRRKIEKPIEVGVIPSHRAGESLHEVARREQVPSPPGLAGEL